MTSETTSEKRPGGRRIAWPMVIFVIFSVLIVLQFARFVVPDFKLNNPPMTHNVQWDSARTEELWNLACRDCHSNETVWPWYSYIAPMTFLVALDTHNGRKVLNVSEDHGINADQMAVVIEEGEMPLPAYVMMHPDANLSDSEKQELIDGILATFDDGDDGDGDDNDDEEDDD